MALWPSILQEKQYPLKYLEDDDLSMRRLLAWNIILLQLAATCQKLWYIEHSKLLIRGKNWLTLLWLEVNDFLWIIYFLGCWRGWLHISLLRILDFSLEFLTSVCDLDSPLIVSWKPRPELMAGDLWLLWIYLNLIFLFLF